MSAIYWAAGIFIFLVTVTVHEYCHGLLADRLGDRTAREAGRLTLNPLKHIDLFWTVLLPIFLFISTRGQFAIGMAKPVPVNFLNLRHPKRDMIWVAAAGPAANFLFAALLSVIFHQFPWPLLLYTIYFNVGLGVFNLLPVPPLDGSRILTGLLPTSWAAPYLMLEPFGFLAVLVLYFTGVLGWFILPGVQFFCKILDVPLLNF